LIGAGCGSKRKPVVATATGGGGAAARPGPAAPAEPEPVDEGPDVRPFEEGSFGSTDFPTSDPTTGEGGPLEDIHFAYDQAALTDEARAILEKHALWLQNHREAKVIVEGHCDQRGTEEYNLALGDQRARAAFDYLVSLGVAGDRMKVVSYGKLRPIDTSMTEAGYAKNRRAHFQVGR
jgi:peptidoglycan-associated lipoprotein